MDLHQIEIFCTIVKHKSFSRAAEALFLSQPTVSGHIKNLENELGVKLLDRLGKRAVPTDAGEVLFRRGLRLLEERDCVRQEIDRLMGTVSGTLTIGGSTIPGAYILPPLISSFKKNHPAITIHLSIDDTAKITAAVLNGSLGMGVVGARLSDPRLEMHPFESDELVVAVPSHHRWSKKKSVSLDALRGEPFVLREQGSGTRTVMENKFARAGFSTADLKIAAVVGSSDAVRQAVMAGLGISILSNRALKDDVEAGKLSILRINSVKMERHFQVILLKGRSHSPLAKAFLNFILAKR